MTAISDDTTSEMTLATELVRLWDRQQEVYIEHREVRFQLMLDLISHLQSNRCENLRVLDLACGPGSMSTRVLERFPTAQVTAVDLDPMLLQLGQLSRADCKSQPIWVQADLRDDNLPALLPEQQYDVIVSTTALHWLTPGELAALYRKLHGLLVPDGVFLNGDYFPPSRPGIRIEKAVLAVGSNRMSRLTNAGAPDWDSWWDRLRSSEEFADTMEAHDEIFRGRDVQKAPSMEFHLESLWNSGFSEVELVWHDLTEGLVCAIR